ncbi:hypothetical protein UNDYM_4147 [Undibacterium sp. YM2]|jgi:hypothetical protein|uniref:hypothetical protein n=1 Tax=Undibacterium sp. YM2 TaxID=2058625 RepID=UPI001331F3CE|nr:hypothetical protein [Undibacterium sp. YM2]BBB68400.1 hypothetical protein UNDYM_4147 [Undibacterium sp. YM2]
MTDFFDMQRFVHLLRAHWAESWREYAWFAGVLMILDLIAMAISFATQSGYSYREFEFQGQITWYMMGLFPSAVIFAGRYFKYLLNPGASLIALMRPASVFEKWLMAFLVISILYPLVFTVLYIVFNYPAVQLAKSIASQWPLCENCVRDFRFYLPFITPESTEKGMSDAGYFLKYQLFFFMLLSAAQALIAGGTAYFKRSPVLRTVLCSFLLFVILTWAGFTPQLGIFARHYGPGEMQYTAMEYGLSIGLWLGLPILLWAVLYFHIKEREVA